MKTLSIFAAAMVVAVAANAQAPTNTFTRTPRTVVSPLTPNGPNSLGAGAAAGGFNTAYGAYSQDSYIQQTGSNNYSNVDQTDNRTGTLAAGSGSTAALTQSGDRNNAYQVQTLNGTSNVAGGRSFMGSTQAGTLSTSTQTQTNGYRNAAVVDQGVGSANNAATQTQSGFDNGARINQTRFTGYPTGSTGNRATQTQSGNLHAAQIDQQGRDSHAAQTQSGYYNDAYIGQGSDGMRNTALQVQTGQLNNARIRQSVGTAMGAANDNYAKQTQSGYGDQADIEQKSSGNYAEQVQSGPGSFYQNNNSDILQERVSSAAYTTQSGNLNTAVVHQH
ncbi:hypothetical protein ACFP2F_02300 [Hymenobacter artigasi]|uniref:Curlin-associated protein n=1 Tax=Hymenobacter artigasi TaxID=2719616 RepID=A0ABX1HCB2_9BACT|nr:hypothetical protein [Hymenobacter artigasi]NKI87883.1 hypothetical protein [Hymenobacter artigasi]